VGRHRDVIAVGKSGTPPKAQGSLYPRLAVSNVAICCRKRTVQGLPCEWEPWPWTTKPSEHCIHCGDLRYPPTKD
jgi:hypothetical protein